MRSAIPIRNLHFPFARVPRAWHGGRRAITTFFDNLSIFFPAGERFFMNAVRANRAHATDERLRADIRAFCAQEGMHAREHEHYNEMLRAHGYDVESMERQVLRVLKVTGSLLSARQQLGVTAALEHFTALMAKGLLGDPRLLAGADPTMTALWRWHALEEYEHRAVAFDVYLAAGGTYLERTWTMLLASLIFWTMIAAQQVRMMARDRIALSLREWWALFEFLFVNPGGMRKLIRPYFEYFRPDFHPNDDSRDDLVEVAVRELDGSAYTARTPAPVRAGAAAIP